MSGNPNEPPAEEPGEHARLDHVYNIISDCLWVILISWVVYFLVVGIDTGWKAGFGRDGPALFLTVGLAIAGVWVIVMVLTAKFATRRAYFFAFSRELKLAARRRALAWITALIIFTLGAMVVCSGGSVNSGFSHFLIATSSIALLMSRATGVRLLIVSLTLGTYVVALGNFVPPVVPLEAGHRMFWSFFNGVSVFSTVILATIAGWKGLPIPQVGVEPAVQSRQEGGPAKMTATEDRLEE